MAFLLTLECLFRAHNIVPEANDSNSGKVQHIQGQWRAAEMNALLHVLQHNPVPSLVLGLPFGTDSAIIQRMQMDGQFNAGRI
jgi:hypothetical protein